MCFSKNGPPTEPSSGAEDLNEQILSNKTRPARWHVFVFGKSDHGRDIKIGGDQLFD
jgi:hypothetical protein